MALLNLSCHQVSWKETQRERERERGRKRRKVIFSKKDSRNKKTRHHHRYRFYLFATMNRQHMCFLFSSICNNQFLSTFTTIICTSLFFPFFYFTY
jgi:hypothetical protein